MNTIVQKNRGMPCQQSEEISAGVMFELAPTFDLRYREPAASSYLQDLLIDPNYSSRAKGFASGLMLCAFNVQVARRICRDLKLSPNLLTHKRWQRSMKERLQQLEGRTLRWHAQESPVTSLLFETRHYLLALPPALIDELIRLAPPVVAPIDRHGGARVFANHVTAFLAHQMRANTKIPVKTLNTTPMLERSLGEICAAYLVMLEPIYEQRKQEIVKASGSLSFAMALTGYSKSRCAQILGGQRP